ncbi:hypothetical protein TNCV_4622871 [Trichonephila clavipes]|nr:hypothetical protein TNCV_4622871 [Trichonephila clavipes]
MREIDDRPRNFKPWSIDEDDTRAGKPSPNFHTTSTGGRLSLDIFNVHRTPLQGGSSVVLATEGRRHFPFLSGVAKLQEPDLISPSQYGCYDRRLVIKRTQVRVQNKAWMHLREKKSDFHLKWIPVSNGKQRTPSVLWWDQCL